MSNIWPNDYQIQASLNWKKGNDETTLIYGLIGEVGEVVEIFKKSRRDEKKINREHLIEELGDVLWYISGIAYLNSIRLQEVINYNNEKTYKRYKIDNKKS